MAANIFTVKRGDRLPALVLFARDEIGTVDLAGFTATLRLVNVLTGEAKINTAATIAPDPAFTAAANVLTSNGHEIVEGQDVTLKTTGTLYAGLSASKKYYAFNVTANTLQLSLNETGGPAITIGGGASGTHTLIVSKVTYEWTSLDTDTPGTYQGQIETTKDGRRLSYPNDSHITLEVISDLSEDSERIVAILAVMDRVQPQAAPKLRQAQIELEVDRALIATTWQPDTFYPAGVEVLPPVRNGYAYLSRQAGTSSVTVINQTDWPLGQYESFTDGQTDSVLEWENVGSDRYNAIAGAETNPYDISRAARACWLLKARMASQMVDDGDLRFSQVHEACINHAGSFKPFKRATRLEWSC